MCTATKGGLSLADIDVTKEAVIQGRVLRGDNPVAGAYVRLLDSGGEFTAEVSKWERLSAGVNLVLQRT